MQELGLTLAYAQDAATHQCIRNHLALPFLHAEEINDIFESVKDHATSMGLQRFTEYIRTQWIESSTSPPPT